MVEVVVVAAVVRVAVVVFVVVTATAAVVTASSLPHLDVTTLTGVHTEFSIYCVNVYSGHYAVIPRNAMTDKEPCLVSQLMIKLTLDD